VGDEEMVFMAAVKKRGRGRPKRKKNLTVGDIYVIKKKSDVEVMNPPEVPQENLVKAKQ
jgi:hypothetical protein